MNDSSSSLPKELEKDIGKTKKEKTTVELFIKGKKSRLDKKNNVKKGKKTYSHCGIETNRKEIQDLLLFTVYCGIFFSFFILIWSIRLEYRNFVMSCFGVIIIIFIIILIFLLKKREKNH
jgi:hypothetical protein